MEDIVALFQDADPFKTWWPSIAAVVVGIVIAVRTVMSGQRCPNDNQIRDLIVIVTGANTGIGYEIAKALAGRGGRIIMACRNMEAAEKAARVIKRELGCRVIKQPQKVVKKSSIPDDGSKESGATTSESGSVSSGSVSSGNAIRDSASSGSVSVSSGCGALSYSSSNMFFIEARYLDLRSFDNVRRFARNIMAEFERVDVLINNAGIIFDPTKVNTVDGFELHLQVNYLSPFLLSHLLLPHLKKSENGRIINVSAHAHAAAKMDFDDPLNVGIWAVRFHARDAFSHSKLAVLLATRWLAKELKDTSITVNCCTPGLVRGTSHLRSSPLMSAICVRFMTFPWMWLFMKNPSQGAQCAIRLATDPKLKHVTGEYFNDCDKAVSSLLGQDKELAKKLYHQTIESLKKVTKLEVDKEEYEPDATVPSEEVATPSAASATPTATESSTEPATDTTKLKEK